MSPMKALLSTARRHKPSSGYRLGDVLKYIVPIYLLIWIVFLPVFHAAHIWFADHGHRFCVEHGQIEDVPYVKGTISQEFQETDHNGLWLSFPSKTKLSVHKACAILECANFQPPLTTFDDAADIVSADELLWASTVLKESAVFRTLWLFAPKTSPPSMVV